MTQPTLCYFSDRCLNDDIAAEAIDAALVLAAFDVPTTIAMSSVVSHYISSSESLQTALTSCSEFGVDFIEDDAALRRALSVPGPVLTF